MHTPEDRTPNRRGLWPLRRAAGAVVALAVAGGIAYAVCSKRPEVKVAELSRTDGRALRQLIEGHSKMQGNGPNWSQRRPIQIDPYFRGAAASGLNWTTIWAPSCPLIARVLRVPDVPVGVAHGERGQGEGKHGSQCRHTAPRTAGRCGALPAVGDGHVRPGPRRSTDVGQTTAPRRPTHPTHPMQSTQSMQATQAMQRRQRIHPRVATQLRMPTPRMVSKLPMTPMLMIVPALPATATLPAVPALPATATLPAVPALPVTATLPAVAALWAMATLPAVETLPATATLRAVAPLPAPRHCQRHRHFPLPPDSRKRRDCQRRPMNLLPRSSCVGSRSGASHGGQSRMAMTSARPLVRGAVGPVGSNEVDSLTQVPAAGRDLLKLPAREWPPVVSAGCPLPLRQRSSARRRDHSRRRSVAASSRQSAGRGSVASCARASSLCDRSACTGSANVGSYVKLSRASRSRRGRRPWSDASTRAA